MGSASVAIRADSAMIPVSYLVIAAAGALLWQRVGNRRARLARGWRFDVTRYRWAWGPARTAATLAGSSCNGMRPQTAAGVMSLSGCRKQ